MCGIIGIVSSIPVSDCAWLTSGRDTMTHRGPDDAGEWWSADGCVGLGQRRLSIIDLSPAGHQPMLDASGELSIVFNGEIYNFVDLRHELAAKGHAFRSQSDTEVLLEAYREWGTGCLSRLNGMFAFALYDSRQQQLFMARDRAGEKPLFYAQANGTLRFASELKGLMADPALPRRIAPDALDCYLTMGYVPGERCILQGVNKLPPAHALRFDLNSGQARVWRYWGLPELDVAADQVDETMLLDELESLLEDAVRRQQVADVPVGILLSGGVDSSLVTAMAVRASNRVKTFTVGFPGFDKYDETGHARLIAQYFGTDHTQLEADHIDPEILLLMAHQYDEPIVDSSMIPTYLVSQLVRQHCTVALGGDGGDELFGGYHSHNRMVFLQKWFWIIPQPIRLLVASLAEHILPVGFKGRNYFQNLGTNFNNDLPLFSVQFDRAIREKLITHHNINKSLLADSIRRQRIPVINDALQRITRMDFENYLAEDILVKVDRASMLNSLEIRAPFLDYRLIEFAFGKVPSPLKATATHRKILLKKLTARLLPPAFDQQRKQGFSIPLASWLHSGPWQAFFHEVLLDSKNSLFNCNAVSQLLASQEKGCANSERLFALVLFELWRREYRVVI